LHKESDDGEWCVLYDGALDDIDTVKIQPRRSVQENGQSPGVKQKLPLHIVHTIDWVEKLDDGAESGVNNDHGRKSKEVGKSCHILRYLRIFIRKPARGWGVSLWEVDVFGTVMD